MTIGITDSFSHSSWASFPLCLCRQILHIAHRLCVRFVSLTDRKICSNLSNFISSLLPSQRCCIWLLEFPLTCFALCSFQGTSCAALGFGGFRRSRCPHRRDCYNITQRIDSRQPPFSTFSLFARKYLCYNRCIILGSTDKFSRAILTHLFCPHFVGKSST